MSEPALKQSKVNEMADRIVAELKLCPALEGVDVFVDRQSDVLTLVQKAVSGSRGLGIGVLLSGWTDLEPSADAPRYRVDYTVRIFGAAILQLAGRPAGEAIPADYAAEQALLWLRHWRYDPSLGLNGEAQVIGGDLVPDAKFLTYELTVTVPLFLGPTRTR